MELELIQAMDLLTQTVKLSSWLLIGGIAGIAFTIGARGV